MVQRYRTTASVILLAAALIATTAGDASAQSARKSAYDGIDMTLLDRMLETMGMTELQGQLVREIEASGGGGVEGMEMSVRRRIAAANAASDAKTRNALLDEAVALYRKVIALRKADVAKAATPLEGAQGTLKLFKAELAMVVADALTRGKPSADRILYLQASQSDRKALAASTATAADVVRRLTADMEEMVPEWRSDMGIWIVIAREAGGMAVETKYRAAVIRFYHGMAGKNSKDPDEAKAAKLDLREARNLGEEFANARRDSFQVRNPARLLVARVLREQGEHKGAMGMLTLLLAGRPSANDAIDARFEHVRNLIEYGRTLAKQGKNGDAKYDSVPAAIKKFRTEAMAVAKEDGAKRRVDLLATMAENYLYETRAATTRASDPAKADAYDAKAQEALIGFLDKYAAQSSVRNAFYDIIYNKYRDRKDRDKLGSIVLMAMASHEFGLADKQYRNKLDNSTALNKTVEILDVVLKRNDAVTLKRVRPDALWQYAWVYNMQKDNFASATKFVQLAREFPDHPLAFQAATNARMTIDGLYTRAAQKALNLRQKYIEVFEVYCGGKNWRDKEDVLPWNFKLAEQYEFFCDKDARPGADRAIAQAANAAHEARAARTVADEATDPQGKAIASATADKAETDAKVAQDKADAARESAIADCVRIAETYERVPDSAQGHMEYMQARQRALRYHTYALILMPKDKDREIRDSALKLADQQLAYSNDALKGLATAPGAEARKDLKNWGGDARFDAAELLLRYGNDTTDHDRAMGILRDIRTEWVDTNAFRPSEDLYIRQLVKGGQIDEAITALFAYRKRYPAGGDTLLRMVIREIQIELEELRENDQPDLVKRFKKLVVNYSKLAGELYKSVEGKDLSDPQCYAITQTYADSLMEAGKHAESLVLFLKCQTQDEAASKKKQGDVTASFVPLRQALADAGTYAEMTTAIANLTAFMADRNIEPDSSRALANCKADVARQMRALKTIKEDDKVFKTRLDDLKQAVTNWFDELESMIKGGAEVSALNVLGIARANEGLAIQAEALEETAKVKDHYAIALKGFRELSGTGFDMTVRHQARMKWLGELGYCRCLLASDKTKETAKIVLLRIRLARKRDTMPNGAPPMGGFSARYMSIESKAKRR